MEKISIKRGIDLYLIPDDKYKTFMLRAYLFRPLIREEVTKNALLGMMLRQGTQKFPTRLALTREMERLYDTEVDTDCRKLGEHQAIYVDLGGVNPAFLPCGDTYWEEALFLFRDLLLFPYAPNGAFPKDTLQLEKENLKDRIDAVINDKRTYAMQQLVCAMCEKEAYGILEDGFKEDIDSISETQLYEHYRYVLQNSPMALFAVGCFQKEKLVEYVKEALKELPERDGTISKDTVIREATTVRYKEEKLNVVQGKLCMGFRTGTAGDEEAFYPLMVMNSVFGSGAHSKLFNEVREKMSLCYYASSGLIRSKGMLVVSSGIEFKNFEVAKKEILHQWEEIKAGHITQAEELAAKRALIHSVRAAQDNKAAQIGQAVNSLLFDDRRTPEDMIAAIEAVTVEQMAEAAKRLTLDTVYFLTGETKEDSHAV